MTTRHPCDGSTWSSGRKTRRSRGFTLLEIMMGTLVFAIGVAGSVGLLAWVQRAGAFNSRIIQASAAGQDMLEQIREDGFTDAQSGTSTNGMFDLSWTVSPATNHWKTVDLTVTWENHDGLQKTLDVSTILTDNIVVSLLPGFVLPPGGGGVLGGGEEVNPIDGGGEPL